MGEATTIRLTDRRQSVYDALQEATGERSWSGAIDVAAEYYCFMAGDNRLQPASGRVARLVRRAREEGSLTAEQIADILDCEELPVSYEVSVTCGRGDE
ncbi:hypothetical protein [Halorarum salinum]|uniref:Uncharacterized protein n=1 Tax=Halorarum salinum TaxID=2743089 RepID=A0A7D5LBB9_9EURY|nr:hypothetical protein [Halobaculum salinum]QLG62471.1 hypothetical protein HUG12_12325 [Halobaculum salinum]